MSRINNKNVKIGDSFVLPLKQSSLSRYEARVESILNDVEEEKKQLLNKAEQEANQIKNNAEQLVQQAQAQAENIIQQAKIQAEEIIKQAEIDKINIEESKQEIINQAREEGFNQGQEDGLNQFKQNASEILKSLDTLAESTFKMKDNIIRSADIDIVELVIAISKKITSRSFDEEMLKELTISAISQLKNKEEITIIVNPQLVENISKLSETFKKEISQLKNIKIVEDSALSCDGTIVESPLSRVDSRISSQIDEIANKLMNGIKDDVQQD